jgi:hypothetical protein
MIDKKMMRSLVEKMEAEAREILRCDADFSNALLALKSEIDSDPLVQSWVSKLSADGRSVSRSFVPHIRIRVRTEQGAFALPRPACIPHSPAVAEVARLTHALGNAASAVIKRSRCYRELEAIVSQAVGSSDRFEGIASEVESAGYAVLICLDLSAYTRVQGLAPPHSRLRQANADIPGRDSALMRLSVSDRKFLKAMSIRTDEV